MVCETLSQKTHHKNKAGGVTQGGGSEFKPQYCQKNNKKKSNVENVDESSSVQFWMCLLFGL
jgi:hypothetical protein